MDFALTEEQGLLRDTMREFVSREISPEAGELDRLSQFPSRAIQRLAELGLLGMAIP